MRRSPLVQPPLSPASADVARFERAERRDNLLDVAALMVASGSVESVTMEAVAIRAGVSRGLVYKHFVNRHALLSALYDRESALLHEQLADEVQLARGLSEKFRVLIRGALAAQESRGATLAALGSVGARGMKTEQERRRRDGQTLRYFAHEAVSEFGLDEAVARAGVAIALGSITTVLAQWRRHPTPGGAERLIDTYVAMAIGGLRALSRHD